MFPKRQFDSALGGDKVLPDTFAIMNFVSSRCQEISALTEAIENPQRTTLISQRLPKHMQRRVMSHSPKRLPATLRQYYSKVQKSNQSIIKRPRRKYRRRPQNLTCEYVRRQCNIDWLESHLWHAKRFHMIKQWGYSLPNFPNDKSFRACYRASVRHCLLQDVSYYRCVEISGSYDTIISGINQLTNPKCGLTFGAKFLSKGNREGNVFIFEKGCYPFGVIGAVKFIWRPISLNEPNKRTLWMWVHPAQYDRFCREIIEVFQLSLIKNDSLIQETDMETDDIERNMKMADISSRMVKYKSSLYSDITVTELKSTLRRLRLTGPLTPSIITDAFLLLQPDVPADFTNKSDWIVNHYSSLKEKQIKSYLNKKKEFWEKMKSITDPAQLPSNLVFPLIIRDPRFSMPEKRTKVVSDTNDVETQLSVSAALTGEGELIEDNPLWNESIRNEVIDNKMSTAEINSFRSKQLVPGTDVTPPYSSKHYLPVVVVLANNATEKRQVICCSWDIIVPAGWVMPIWLALVWRGARVGGLREADSMYREANIMSPLFPDSKAGKIADKYASEELIKKYFATPPAKRPNFNSLGIVSPFIYPWKELVNDWNHSASQVSSYFILRDRMALSKIDNAVKCFSNGNSSDGCKCFGVELNENEKESALIGINITIDRRGCISEHAVICLPTKEDLEVYFSDKRASHRPTESVHNDRNKSKRIKFRKEQIALLKRLKRKLKKYKLSKDTENYNSIKTVILKATKNKQSKINKLWLPHPSGLNIKDSADRKVMGMVVSGGYSFAQCCSAGLAYVPLSALCHLIRLHKEFLLARPQGRLKRQPIVLVRIPSERVYSFAILNVHLDHNSRH